MRRRLHNWVETLAQKAELRRLLRHFDTDAFAAIRARHEHTDPAPGSSKYLDVETWLPEKLSAARRLGAADDPRRRVLDIGTGTGFFPWVWKEYGHLVHSLDLDEVPLYRDLVEYLRVPRTVLRVEPYVALPDLGGRFDLITAFMICFNGHKSSSLWGPAEWEFFLDDLRANQLRPEGTIFLSLNAEADGSCYTPELAAFFRERGGRLEGREVMLPGESPPRSGPLFRLRSRLHRRALHGVRNLVNPLSSGPRYLFEGRSVPRERLFAGQGRPKLLGTFQVPGSPRGTALEDVTADARGLTFPRLGEWYLRTSQGDRKVLLLDGQATTLDRVLEVFRFVSNNLVHSQVDEARARGNPLLYDHCRPDHLLAAFFASQQPLKLHCLWASRFLCYLLHLEGVRTRIVTLASSQDGHVVTEAWIPDQARWIFLDPDYGVWAEEAGGEVLSTKQLAATLDTARFLPAGQKAWLLPEYNRHGPDFCWTPACSSEGPTLDPEAYRETLASLLHEAWVYESTSPVTWDHGRPLSSSKDQAGASRSISRG